MPLINNPVNNPKIPNIYKVKTKYLNNLKINESIGKSFPSFPQLSQKNNNNNNKLLTKQSLMKKQKQLKIDTRKTR